MIAGQATASWNLALRATREHLWRPSLDRLVALALASLCAVWGFSSSMVAAACQLTLATRTGSAARLLQSPPPTQTTLLIFKQVQRGQLCTANTVLPMLLREAAEAATRQFRNCKRVLDTCTSATRA